MPQVNYNKFWSQDKRPRSELVPSCSGCNGNADGVEMIDAVMVDDSSVRGGILPVWHCNGCGLTFQGRVYQVENILSNNGIKQGVVAADASSTLDLYTTYTYQGKSLEQTIKDVSLGHVENHWGHGLGMADEVVALKSRVTALSDKLEKLLKFEEERRSDPLSALRERVAKFKLAV